MERTDRRVAKTKAAICQALNDLMLEKKYANITIQDIIDRANVGRTTFYSHFMDKDELLNSCIVTVFESFHEQMT
jgi:AcrR family transcriptional regulator